MEIKLRLLDTRLNCVVLVIPRELHSSLQVTLLVPCAIILVISCSQEIHCCVMRLGVATMKNRKSWDLLVQRISWKNLSNRNSSFYPKKRWYYLDMVSLRILPRRLCWIPLLEEKLLFRLFVESYPSDRFILTKPPMIFRSKTLQRRIKTFEL